MIRHEKGKTAILAHNKETGRAGRREAKEVLKQVRRGEVEAEGGDQGASDCRPPRGIHLQGNLGLEQLHRRGNTLNPFLGYLLSSYRIHSVNYTFFCS